jgi:hypothetical protein
MSHDDHEVHNSTFIDLLRGHSSSRVIEFGAVDAVLLSTIISQCDWTDSMELHCAQLGDDNFDGDLTAAAAESSVVFEVVKHKGSETEVSDALMEAAEVARFDGAFISNTSSKEALLAACMMCDECLKAGGVFAVSDSLVASGDMHFAITSFRDMYGDAYQEVSNLIFIKN